jgi:hypothetical protein
MARAIVFLVIVALAIAATTPAVFARGFAQEGGVEYPAGGRSPEIPAADGTCNQPLDAGVGGQFAGSTAGHANLLNSYSCSGWDESGPEVIYTTWVSFSAAPGTITAALSDLSPGVDLDVFILSASGCPAGTCADAGTYGDMTATASGLPAGDYYIAVDGYLGAQGSYVLTVSQTGGTSLPYIPSNPSPASGATGIDARSLQLGWDGGHSQGSAAGVTYYVFLREDGQPAGSEASCSPFNALGDASRLSCSGLMLKPKTRYHWWVVAESVSLGGYGLVTGPSWEFTTLPDVYLPLVRRNNH